eukprot:3382825-Pyramimonas_sp.AAC.1
MCIRDRPRATAKRTAAPRATANENAIQVAPFHPLDVGKPALVGIRRTQYPRARSSARKAKRVKSCYCCRDEDCGHDRDRDRQLGGCQDRAGSRDMG